jgi:hypothetical protein
MSAIVGMTARCGAEAYAAKWMARHERGVVGQPAGTVSQPQAFMDTTTAHIFRMRCIRLFRVILRKRREMELLAGKI